MSIRIDDQITFRKLEMLLAFIEVGSLARAAERLDTSAVSVHRALRTLEEAMRCALFRTEGRNLVPLEAALVLAETAREVLGRMARGIDATRKAGGYSSQTMRIGSLYSLTVQTVPRLLVDLKVRRPQLQPELVLGSNADLLDKLQQGDIDAALMAIPPDQPQLESLALFDDEIFFAAPSGSRYSGMDTVDLRLCKGERFVSLGEGFATYAGFREAFSQAGFEPEVAMYTDDIFSLMSLVRGGVGCTLLPGRVRDVFAHQIDLLPLHGAQRMRQHIGLSFLRARERDPNLLALQTVCRLNHPR
ncbi:MAG: HTH-type transcriptional regulator GltC [Paracidovorax wautersii]|uniref:HTH-type transcriptional regulator GltC n=1 Tax=Paracidovorax wautersii TaxID=1177982 RepID=A0A7V8FMU6_9BURK|nr:MAG: HTH-type transcriptional regulator GltC [Paracidovorax wautersii]